MLLGISQSNDALSISLVAPSAGGVTSLHTFAPKMTYSIFGDEEQIFGYKGLKINLRYNASDMRPHLSIAYNKKFNTVGDTEPTDVKAIMEEFLPTSSYYAECCLHIILTVWIAAFEKTKAFEATLSNPSNANWTPPGEVWQTIESEGKIYEIRKGNMVDPAIQQLVKRVQIMVPLNIEGGMMIDFEDAEWSLDRWTVFFLYEKKTDVAPPASPYAFMGYCTVFRYCYFPRTVPADTTSQDRPAESQEILDLAAADIDLDLTPCRSRISQFVILPPYQRGGNGSRFYNTIFDYYLQNSPTVEITVEDPNEAFDDMRDLNDLQRLRKDPAFAAIKINTAAPYPRKGPAPRDIVDTAALEKIRQRFKIAPRQFHRVTELHLLSHIPLGVRQTLIDRKPTASGAELRAQEHEYDLWRLWVKQRLYKHNKDTLAQLERIERIEKLDQALGGVEADYARLLREYEGRWKKKGPVDYDAENGIENGESVASSSRLTVPTGLKRQSAAPETESEEEEEEPRAKKIRFS